MKHLRVVLPFIPVLFLFFGFSCSYKANQTKEPSIVDDSFPPPEVSGHIVKPQLFAYQIFSNGTVKAYKDAALYFETSGIIDKINVKNGDKVKKGEVITVLKNEKQLLAIEKAIENRNQAITELNSLLLGFGGKENDTTTVNPKLLQNLKSQSGYNLAVLNLKSARIQYEQTFLKAPFDGIVADIKQQENDKIDNSKPFCRLLKTDRYIVDFLITEQDLSQINTGQTVKVIPIAYNGKQVIKGKIIEINPVVDRQGLIKIKAKITPDKNKMEQRLLSGMNAKVIIENTIPRSLAIPKSALVLRSNKQVVFTYHKGKAQWNYVKTGDENSRFYLITEGLNFGDTVITRGALTLAHDAQVKLTKIN